jgi:hypothetical protein
MSNVYKGKEYKLEAWQYDCFEYWKDDNVNYIIEHFWNDILLIQNKNWRNYWNIFDDSQIKTKASKWMTIYWIELKVDNLEDSEYQVNDYDDDDKNRNRIKKYIWNHTIIIEARWYSQNDYDDYYILIKDIKKKKEIEKQLDFIERIFNIVSTEVILYERKTIDDNNIKYYSKWKIIDNEKSQIEFVDVWKLSQILIKRNNIKRYEIGDIPTEANYMG